MTEKNKSNLGDFSSKQQLKGVTIETVPLETAEKLHTALKTTLECLELDGFGKNYAISIAKETLESIDNNQQYDQIYIQS